MMRKLSGAGLALVVLLVGGLGACDDPARPDRVLPPVLLPEVVSGDRQQAVRGYPTPEPLVVRVVDLDGDPRPDVPVTWSVTVGGGLVQALSTTTDEQGLARAEWRLGSHTWEQAVEAAAGSGRVTFSLTAEPEDWLEVLDVHASVQVVDGFIRAQAEITNGWVGHVRYRLYSGCPVQSARLFTAQGDEVPGFQPVLWCVLDWSVTVPPGYVLTAGAWRIATDGLAPGIYAVVLDFNPGLSVNGRTTLIPPATLAVVVE